jgi:hypothetical protein
LITAKRPALSIAHPSFKARLFAAVLKAIIQFELRKRYRPLQETFRASMPRSPDRMRVGRFPYRRFRFDHCEMLARARQHFA